MGKLLQPKTMHNHSVVIVFYNFGYSTKQDTLIMFQVKGREVYLFHKYIKVNLLPIGFYYHPVSLNDPELSFMTNDGTFLVQKRKCSWCSCLYSHESQHTTTTSNEF